MGSMSREKGKRGEREVAAIISALLEQWEDTVGGRS